MKTDSYFEKAGRLRVKSRFKEAAAVYEALLAARGVDTLERAEAHLGAADCHRLQGDFTASKRHAREAEGLFGRVGSPRLVDARVSWALSLRASGEPKKAVGLLRKALAFYQADSDPEGIVFAHWSLGGTLRIAGDLKSGWKHLREALKRYRALGDREGEAYTHCALGGLERMLGRYGESGRHYREANRLHRIRKDAFGTAYSYCGLGNVERMHGRFDGALRYFRKAEKLYRRIGDKVSYAYTLWSIGTTLKMKGDLAGAGEPFRLADGLFRVTGDLRGRSYAALGQAELLWLRGKDGEKERAAAERFARSGGYAWELLHAKGMRGGKAGGNARKLYAALGSRFYPKTIPVNWP